MQAQLIFNLPEDQELFGYHCRVMEYRDIISEFTFVLMRWDKNDATPTLDEVRAAFHKLLATYNYE